MKCFLYFSAPIQSTLQYTPEVIFKNIYIYKVDEGKLQQVYCKHDILTRVNHKYFLNTVWRLGWGTVFKSERIKKHWCTASIKQPKDSWAKNTRQQKLSLSLYLPQTHTCKHTLSGSIRLNNLHQNTHRDELYCQWGSQTQSSSTTWHLLCISVHTLVGENLFWNGF